MGGGDIALDMLIAGGLAAMGLIPVVFFAIHRRDRAPLWLGLFCLALSLHFIFSTQRSLAAVVIPDIAPDIQATLEAFAWYLSLPALALFFRELFRLAASRHLVTLIFWASVAAATATVLLPARLFTHIAPVMQVFTLAAAAWLAWLVLAVGWQRRSGWIALLSLMPLTYPIVILDVMQNPGLRIAVVPIGIAAFLVAPVVVLARRLARALNIEALRAEEEVGRASRLGRALRNQTKFVNDLVDSVPVALSLRDPEGKYLFVNRTWEQWFGGKRGEVVGSRVQERFSPEVAERVLALDRAALERGPGAEAGMNEFEYNGRRYTQTRNIMTEEGGNVLGLLVASIDTTERHEQDRLLRDQMAITRAVIEDNPSAMYVKDTEGGYITVNDAWVRMLGVAREDAIGRNVRELFKGKEAERHHEEDMRLLAKGEGWSEVESHRTGPDGKPQWLLVRKGVLRRSNGEVIGLVGTNTDITRLKQYEAELAMQERRYALVVHASNVGIVDWNGFTHETYYSPRYCEMLGYPADADTSKFPDYFKVLLHPDDREQYTKLWQDFVKGQGPGGRFAESLGPHQHRLLRRDGTYAWVEVSGVAVRDEKGFVTRWIAATTDVTERRAQEQQLRDHERELGEQKTILETTFDNIDQGITMVDRNLRIIAFNRRFLELLEFPPDLFGSGMTLEQAFRYNAARGEYGPGDPDEQVRTRLELARRFEPHAFERRRPNGQVLAIRGQPLPNGEGFVTTYSDITEHKRAEEQMRQSMALREEVERMSRHDLKTPINSVIAVSRMLRESGKVAPEDAELLATVERAGSRILNMVNLSLDLFRMEQGTYQFHPQAVDLDEVASKVATDLQGQAASKNVQVLVARTARVVAHAEELLCYSMFANLVKNAIEAAPEGTQVVIQLDLEGNEAVARVHNEGAVPEEMRGRFFQKYATAGKTAGLGLGTYSAQLLARAQRGNVTFETSEAAGTTLTVRLEAATPEEARRRDAIPGGATGTVAAPRLPPLRILVADDDEFNRIVLRRHLPTPPLEVAFAVNGRAALKAAEAEWPDVVLMDLEMPVMDGYEATKTLREIEKSQHRKRLLIVAISSNDEEVIIKRALAAGCDHYLVKPAPRGTLWRLLAGAKVPLASGGTAGLDASPTDEVVLDPDLASALDGFLASRRQAVDELRQALAAGDRPAFRRIAHRVAGSCALYGFKWGAIAAKGLERDAGDGDAADLAARAKALREHLDSVKIRIATNDAALS